MANSSPAANPTGKSSPVYDWFQERLEIGSIADDISAKYVAPHGNIFYCLCGITPVPYTHLTMPTNNKDEIYGGLVTGATQNQ